MTLNYRLNDVVLLHFSDMHCIITVKSASGLDDIDFHNKTSLLQDRERMSASNYCYTAHFIAKMYAISSDTHQLQLFKLHHFKL